jgi:hypothetical protein
MATLLRATEGAAARQARHCGTQRGERAPTVALRWLITVANLAGELPLEVILDGRPRPSHSRYAWSAGGLVLTIATVLPEPGLAFELISTYTGHPDTDTIATHLTLGQSRDGEIDSRRHPHQQLNPAELARACAYDHAGRLIDVLGDDRHPARVELDEHTFSELERVE